MTLHKGKLPRNCPNCKAKDVDYYWDMEEYDKQIVYEATCPECDQTFNEFNKLKPIGWERAEEK